MEQRSLFILRSPYQNVPETGASTIIFYLHWKNIAASKQFPECGQSGNPSWILIFYLGFYKTQAWVFQTSTREFHFWDKFPDPINAYKSVYKCCLLFKHPNGTATPKRPYYIRELLLSPQGLHFHIPDAPPDCWFSPAPGNHAFSCSLS